MDVDFWHKLWETNDIGWHNEDVNKLFLKNFPQLELRNNSRIFIPLCGKTVDIKWLLDNGYSVVGIELNENAIKALFTSLNLKPTIKNVGSLTLYSSENIDIFVGDIFTLDKSILGKVDAVYDRGAIVALPTEMRKKYTSLLVKIADNAPLLIISFEYDQNLMQGPPFSVKESQLKDYYNDYYNFKLMETIKPKAFEKLDMSETVWLLSPKNNT
jgi:thiopurine S-methyltransferase